MSAARDRLRRLRGGRHARRAGDRGRGLPRGAQAGLEAHDRLRRGDRASSAPRRRSRTTRARSSRAGAWSRVVNFPPRQIGPVRSEVLVLGASDAEGRVILLGPDSDVPLGCAHPLTRMSSRIDHVIQRAGPRSAAATRSGPSAPARRARRTRRRAACRRGCRDRSRGAGRRCSRRRRRDVPVSTGSLYHGGITTAAKPAPREQPPQRRQGRT